ncbi:hypothetical protein [Bradyrhizobium iriomotense]|uniref:hypothetical protein n=1 Tax=Bradyrhizobium iriomotense TaxID=441950 RepID=UPI001B89E36C|nr:hypothetical protein [Bradyrhizobium iriomotense]
MVVQSTGKKRQLPAGNQVSFTVRPVSIGSPYRPQFWECAALLSLPGESGAAFMTKTVWGPRRKSVRLRRRSPIHKIKLALPFVDNRLAAGEAGLARLMVVSGNLIGHERCGTFRASKNNSRHQNCYRFRERGNWKWCDGPPAILR